MSYPGLVDELALVLKKSMMFSRIVKLITISSDTILLSEVEMTSRASIVFVWPKKLTKHVRKIWTKKVIFS